MKAVVDALRKHGVGARVRRSQGSELEPEVVTIAVEPLNSDGARMELSIDHKGCVDVGMGYGTVFECFYADEMPRIVSLVEAVINGRLSETVRLKDDRVASCKGVIETKTGRLHVSRFNTQVGWLFIRKRRIAYAPYASGAVSLVVEG
jgi:hypothetical protein